MSTRGRTGWIVAGGAAAAGLAVLPLLTSSRSILTWGVLLFLNIALAQSWNLLSGFGGQVNLGHAAFFGLGALLTRFLWFQGQPLLLALAAGTLAAAAAGVIVGAPSLRLHGPYFAIGTLAVAEILRITASNVLPEVSTLPTAALAGYRLAPRYVLALGVAALTMAVAGWLPRSRFGHGLAAVREDEDVAEASGVHVFRHKLLAFVLSAALAGTTGGVFGYYHVSFYPQFAFSPLWTFDALLITFLGGVGTVWGPAAGTAVFLLLRETLALRLVEVHLLIFGILFVLIVLAFPGGLVEAWRTVAARRAWRGGETSAARAVENL
ncbi:MAG: branched-chain amino acid ABC transporter permease [Armatimonadota bacterium]|nr:branched-chain amino acid ABC transporter permease [Armatimonadota bacterium]MDR7450807.1 branched-chain amino acid ABC transporter permease [Armatimonadota bacterium]MDR7466163.1 branched-chain amino acid ABC transporter permease [Armatimonadota bacterium]MDR7493800.1 branched-chain amino acid ABC transporter permease [Armatimonadota bacterium]MDR7499039.1 branched-chain amino acid ABC transporter permease [Armatimonadota bacterium]